MVADCAFIDSSCFGKRCSTGTVARPSSPRSLWTGMTDGMLIGTLVLRGDELVPLLHHVLIFVHHGVPAGDGTHPLLVGAAVPHGARLLQEPAIRPVNVLLGRLAFHPVRPLIGFHVVLGGLKHG